MANKNIFSSDFVSAVKASVDVYLERDDVGDNCINAFSLGLEEVFKDFREADGEELNPDRLRLMIMSVVSTGQVPSLAIRKGRNGGIYRVKPAAVRKPVAKAGKAANKTTKTAKPAEVAETKVA